MSLGRAIAPMLAGFLYELDTLTSPVARPADSNRTRPSCLKRVLRHAAEILTWRF